MAISFVGSSVTTPYADIGITIAKPSGVTADDLLVAQIVTDLPVTITAPSGWSLIRLDEYNSCQQAIYYKVATSNEPDTYTWWFSDLTGTVGGIAAYRNVDTTAPIQTSSGGGASDTDVVTGPSLTLSHDGMLLFFGAVINDISVTFTPATDMTERWDASGYDDYWGMFLSIMLDDQVVTAGNTGTRTAGISTTVWTVIGATVGLKEATTGATTVYLDDAGTGTDVTEVTTGATTKYLDDTGTGTEVLEQKIPKVLQETRAYKDGTWTIYSLPYNTPTDIDPTPAYDDDYGTRVELLFYYIVQDWGSESRYIKEVRIYGANPTGYLAFVEYWNGSNWVSLGTIGYVPNPTWYVFPADVSCTKWRVFKGQGVFYLYEMWALPGFNASETLQTEQPPKELSDAGTGTDTFQFQGTITLSDTGTFADSVALPQSLVDSGSGEEVLEPLRGSPDGAIGYDALVIPQREMSLEDSGSGIDELSWGFINTLADTGSGVDDPWKWLSLDDAGIAEETLGGQKETLLTDVSTGADWSGRVILLEESGTSTDLFVWGITLHDDGFVTDNAGRLLTLQEAMSSLELHGLYFEITESATGKDGRLVVPLGAGFVAFRDKD